MDNNDRKGLHLALSFATGAVVGGGLVYLAKKKEKKRQYSCSCDEKEDDEEGSEVDTPRPRKKVPSVKGVRLGH